MLPLCENVNAVNEDDCELGVLTERFPKCDRQEKAGVLRHSCRYLAASSTAVEIGHHAIRRSRDRKPANAFLGNVRGWLVSLSRATSRYFHGLTNWQRETSTQKTKKNNKPTATFNTNDLVAGCQKYLVHEPSFKCVYWVHQNAQNERVML